MSKKIELNIDYKPVLDPKFVPAVLWNRKYQELVSECADSHAITICLERADGSASLFSTKILPHSEANRNINIKYVERIVKFLLWQKGGCKIIIAGDDAIAGDIAKIYSPTGERAFDYEFMGERVYGQRMSVESCSLDDISDCREDMINLGRNLDGCRIGFDLGGSDRKCAAVIDGEVVFSEEVAWDPYFEKDPSYHYEGINDSLKRAAAHLPRVDAIGGSSAGVYVNNEVRVASLFRGLPRDVFEKEIVGIFFKLKKEWNNIPFEVVNDGEVTALAGSMSMNDNAVFGLSMGTSQAVGYVNNQGNITPWLNELAFAPIDYRDDAPEDEWSKDIGCGVQYFSQQAVARLAPLAGIEFAEGTPFPEQLIQVQKLMIDGDERARKIYETIGTYLGYSVAHYCEFYDIRNMLILGRVTSGDGGEIIIEKAMELLRELFPEIADSLNMRTPSEKDKRLGQAVAAASLPKID